MPAPTPPDDPIAVPDTPDRTEGQDTFNTKAFAFNDWFAPFQAWLVNVLTYIIDAITWIDSQADAAEGSAAAAAVSATAAEGFAGDAAASAASALLAPGTYATSATSLTPSIASKSFTLDQTGKTFVVGQFVTISDSSTPTEKWISGAITAFNSASGEITVMPTAYDGNTSGTSWVITSSAPVQPMRTTKKLVNAFSTSGYTAVSVQASQPGLKASLSGAMTANTLKTVHSVSNGSGSIVSFAYRTIDNTSRTVRIVVTVDGGSPVTFDSTSAVINAISMGGNICGSLSSSSNGVLTNNGSIDYNSSILIQAASSLTETDKLAFYISTNEDKF